MVQAVYIKGSTMEVDEWLEEYEPSKVFSFKNIRKENNEELKELIKKD